MIRKNVSIPALSFLSHCVAFWLVKAVFAAEVSPAWDAEWERTVKAAEQEGQVVVYKIAHDSEWHAFQKRFPKIKVVLIPGSAAQIQQRLLSERRAESFSIGERVSKVETGFSHD